MSETHRVEVTVTMSGTVEIETDDKNEAHKLAAAEAREQLGRRNGAQDLEVIDVETSC